MDPKMMEECAKMMQAMQAGEGSKMAAGATAGGYFLGKGILRRLFASPLAVFGIGAAAGILAYKYRKEIINAVEPARKEIVKAAMKAADVGKDFVLEQKEKLSDIIAEIKEEEEEKAKKPKEAPER
ncbi:MAG: hypothetical protein ACOYU2_01975 [Nitrospirota bacterium]